MTTAVQAITFQVKSQGDSQYLVTCGKCMDSRGTNHSGNLEKNLLC